MRDMAYPDLPDPSLFYSRDKFPPLSQGFRSGVMEVAVTENFKKSPPRNYFRGIYPTKVEGRVERRRGDKHIQQHRRQSPHSAFVIRI